MSPAYKLEIKKSKRKTLSIHCDYKDNEHIVIVKSPNHLKKSTIESIIEKKSTWISTQLINIEKNKHMIFPNSFTTGKTLYVLGKPYTLDCQNHDKKNLFFNEHSLILTCPNDEKRNIVIKWYKNLAKDVLTDRTLHYSKIIKKPINKLTIKQQKTRWGSCSSNHNINLNWLLIKTPLNVINYVVLHECCHLVHMNHSRNFWQLVKQHMPQYNIYKNWLSIHGNAILNNHY